MALETVLLYLRIEDSNMGVPAIVGSVALVLVSIAIGRWIHVWWKYRGPGVVTCPENQRPAGVRVDSHTLTSAALGKPQALRLSSCSRWPERQNCGQECLNQLAASPEDCMVRNLLLQWFEGKKCTHCGLDIGPVSLAGAKPAVLRADERSVEWSEIPAEQLQETLSAARPICFACHLAEKMAREHQSLVIDRSERKVHF